MRRFDPWVRRCPLVFILAVALAAVAQEDRGIAPVGVAAAPPKAQTSFWYRSSVALVVGIDRYSNGIPPLDRAVSDARLMAEEMRRQGFTVYTLLDQQATRAEIMRYLETELPPRVGPRDRFVFYFAGHGQTRGKGEMGYLVPADGSRAGGRDQFHTYLSMSELKDVLIRGYKARHVLLVADACFSGILATRAMPAAVEAAMRQDGKMVLTAGGQGQSAVDGLFTAVLVNGLKGRADINGDGVVTFNEVALYTQQRVVDRSNGKQRPDYGRWDGEGEIAFRPLQGSPEIGVPGPEAALVQPLAQPSPPPFPEGETVPQPGERAAAWPLARVIVLVGMGFLGTLGLIATGWHTRPAAWALLAALVGGVGLILLRAWIFG